VAYTIYDDFAWFFDRYWADGFLDDAREGFESFFLSRLSPGSRVLDVCCGTGQMARLLCERRFEVVGVDGSQPMIELARENAPEATFEQADVCEFVPAGSFRAALSMYDSVNHFESLESIRAVFLNVFNALEPGGLFLFDVNTADGFQEAAAETYADVETKRVCVVKTHFDENAGHAVAAITLFQTKDEKWSRRDFKIEEFLHDAADLKRTLHEVGFADVEILSAEDDFGMNRGYGRLFFLATKA